MLLRATTGNDCVQFRFEGGQSARKIDKSVGQGGFNVKADVLKIRRLLNLIAPTEGGPPPATPEGLGLKEDGIAGPKTIGALKAFQLRQGTGSDARVDPGGPTLKRMNEVPKNALALRNKGRLLKVAQVFPDLVSITEKARLAADQAIDFLRLGASGLGTGKRAFDVANLYFAFGNQSNGQTLAELSFIRTTYLPAREVLNRRPDNLTGGSPFGISIFTIDPLGLDHVAYSPTQAADDNRPIPEVYSGLIFPCDKSDTIPDRSLHACVSNVQERGALGSMVGLARRLAGILYALLRDGPVYAPRPPLAAGPVRLTSEPGDGARALSDKPPR